MGQRPQTDLWSMAEFLWRNAREVGRGGCTDLMGSTPSAVAFTSRFLDALLVMSSLP